MYFSTQSNGSDEHTATENAEQKVIKEVILIDNGAVVPDPKIRRLVLALKNKDEIMLSYLEPDENSDNEDIIITNDSHDIIRDEIEKIADYAEDGMDVKAGKQPCVGMNSMDIAVVYSTGDTARFAVTGAARCDPTLYPSVWALDSMATQAFRTHKNRPH